MRRFTFKVRLRALEATKPHVTVGVLAKTANEAEKLAAKSFPKLRVWDVELSDVLRPALVACVAPEFEVAA